MVLEDDNLRAKVAGRIDNKVKQSWDRLTSAQKSWYPCDKCNRGYLTEWALAEHMQLAHPLELVIRR